MIFKGVNGQSLFDVCLNTYGSLEYMYKMIQDSGVENIDQPVISNQSFDWNPELIKDNSTYRTTTQSGVIFATVAANNGNLFCIIKGDTPNPTPGTPYVPPNNNNMPNKYQKTQSFSYTATVDGEYIISLPSLVDKDILQVEKEIKPLKSTEFSWNKTTAVLTLAAIADPFLKLAKNETIFILYTEIVTE